MSSTSQSVALKLSLARHVVFINRAKVFAIQQISEQEQDNFFFFFFSVDAQRSKHKCISRALMYRDNRDYFEG
jgi:hypothetical protein